MIETYVGPARGSHGSVRARPIDGQFYPVTMNVECSRDVRKRHPIGTRFRIFAKEVTREDGTPFIILTSVGPWKSFQFNVHRHVSSSLLIPDVVETDDNLCPHWISLTPSAAKVLSGRPLS